MKRNETAYSLLFTIHSHLSIKHNVPDYIKGSYRLTIEYVLPFYFNSPILADKIQKSTLIRNRVCHFKPIRDEDVILLKSICNKLNINRAAYRK